MFDPEELYCIAAISIDYFCFHILDVSHRNIQDFLPNSFAPL